MTFSEGLIEYLREHEGDIGNFFLSDVLDKQDEIEFGKSNALPCKKQKMEEVKVHNPEEEMKDQRGPSLKPQQAIFIVPFGVPNSGKSTIWKQVQSVLKEEVPSIDWSFAYVSSDQIRGEETQKLISKGMNKDQAFDKCRKVATDRYK